MSASKLVPMYESPDHLGNVVEMDQATPPRHEWGGCCDMQINSGRLLRDLYADRDAAEPVASAGDVVEVRVGTAGYSIILCFYKQEQKLFATDWRCIKYHLREPLADKRKKAREAAGWVR